MIKFIEFVKKCLHKVIALLSKIQKGWDSFSKRRMFFLITRGTLIATFLFGVISFIISHCKLNPEITWQEVILLIIISLSSIFFTFLIDRWIHKVRINRHFPHSHPIVTKEIIEIYSKKAILDDYIGSNKSIDRIIKSPLDYAAATLNGNSAPHFTPKREGFNDMYHEDVKLIVAITAENPNLWLDPTLCFYLINCFAVSLLRHTDNIIGRRLAIRDYVDSLCYNSKIDADLAYLNRLINLPWNYSQFDFFRFFLYDDKQKECLINTVFPSLKATHDLFKIKSYFNQKDDIKNSLITQNKLPDFNAHIDFLWDQIAQRITFDIDTKMKIINIRKNDHLPEFVFLFRENDQLGQYVSVHTFVDGEPFYVNYARTDTNNDGYKIAQSFVSYIAQSVQMIGRAGQYIPIGKYLNTDNSYLEWV